jgi:hypothetical protein
MTTKEIKDTAVERVRLCPTSRARSSTPGGPGALSS